MRVVLDANILVSAVISGKGHPARILDLWEQERFELVISTVIIEELGRVMCYPKIQKKYNLPEVLIEQFLGLIASQAVMVNPIRELTIIKADPTDNRFLECALEGGALNIVSGDQHLLELGEIEGIAILPPMGFLALLGLA